MKLYTVIGSPNSRKALAAVHQLGIAVEIEYLDYFESDLESPEYRVLNPNCMVPTLVDGDFSLWESNAIMQYLADKVPGNTLFPRDPQTRADIVRWQCWELAHYNKALGVLSFEAVAKTLLMDSEPDQALIDWAVQELGHFAPILEKHLRDRDYVVGASLTLADFSLIHIEPFKDAVPFDWSPYPNLNAYYQRIGALPTWSSSAPASPEAMGRRPAA